MAIKFIDAILENDDAKRHLETQLQEKLKSLALAHESEEKETLARATKRASTAAQVASKLNGNGKSP